jgi:hypothetical protein
MMSNCHRPSTGRIIDLAQVLERKRPVWDSSRSFRMLVLAHGMLRDATYASGWKVQRSFRRIRGYKQMPALVAALRRRVGAPRQGQECNEAVAT